VGNLILQLVPTALGIVLSPLAIMALVAELLSRRRRGNGIAYLIGWALALVVVLGLALWLFTSLDVHAPGSPPSWVAIVRVVLGLFLVAAAVWVYRRGGTHARKMASASTPVEVVAAAPQLPGWLKAVDSFTPTRSLLLGFGIFAFNPVDASCAVIAALDLVIAPVAVGTQLGVAIGFVILGILPVAIPVIYVLVRGENAAGLLGTVRTWIATHTNVMNAALLLVIGCLQLQKGLAALIG
jgi:hypothetical protein